MRLGFTDETRLLARARNLTKTDLGRLQLWHMGRYKSYEGVSFEDRTPGDVIEEFYLTVAAEMDQLVSRRDDLEAAELERLSDLEDILSPSVSDRTSLRGLSTEDSNEVYGMAHKTGDSLADYWEYRISKDLPVDLDLKHTPPRDEWDEEMING